MVRGRDNDNGITKSILLFAGGFIAGYALKMAMESDMFKELKANALDMVDNYFNHEIEYVDVDIDDGKVVDVKVDDAEVVDVDIDEAEVVGEKQSQRKVDVEIK